MSDTVPRMGRPKSPDSRGVQTQIRLRPEERAEVEEAAQLAALPPTTWMRATVLREARKALAAAKRRK